jgi:hypothetical protein
MDIIPLHGLILTIKNPIKHFGSILNMPFLTFPLENIQNFSALALALVLTALTTQRSSCGAAS